MKKIVLIGLLFFISFSVFSQQTLKPEEVSKHVGDSVRVIGKVYSIRHFTDAKNAPTLINIGAAYPNQLFTVVIYGDDRKNFKTPPEEYFKDKTVWING